MDEGLPGDSNMNMSSSLTHLVPEKLMCLSAKVPEAAKVQRHRGKQLRDGSNFLASEGGV